MRCRHKDSTAFNSLTKSIKNTDPEGSIAPVGSGLNLAQALAMASDGRISGDAEIWVKSGLSETLHQQMSAIPAHKKWMDSNWHLACIACYAAELEVELWG